VVPVGGSSKRVRGASGAHVGIKGGSMVSWQAWGCLFQQHCLPPPGLKGDKGLVCLCTHVCIYVCVCEMVCECVCEIVCV